MLRTAMAMTVSVDAILMLNDGVGAPTSNAQHEMLRRAMAMIGSVDAILIKFRSHRITTIFLFENCMLNNRST